MNPWSGYALQDFIPFTADIYFRLLERMGEAFWPLQVLTMALGALAVVLALKDRGRLACLLIAPVWAFVGFAFFVQRYAELNWAGGYLGYVFYGQAILLLVTAAAGLGFDKASRRRPSTVLGAVIALAGLIGLPFMVTLTAGSWFQAEVFGIHPDPTAVVTLGLAMIILRGWVLGLIATIPAIWLLISALTLSVLEAPGAILVFTILAVGLFGLVWKSVERLSAG
ncbi:DUF6064 family protein [Methylonatrum kenyense]|uniref:DUF6064 family protein n=1 Tax=Methylonatrum kenyense TaxID=455253 RepID=UPI0020BD5649|nr:DUF6064 family protein [Methylonatrum kenyense]MCK8516336.1 DUF6064 family protein [Methylonatrum kenyense]